MCKNAQYEKDWQEHTIGLFKFQINLQSQNCINCGVIKSKHSEKLAGKIHLQTTYVCEFHINITDVNISAGRRIKTLKPNGVPLLFTYLPYVLLENVTLLLNL